MIRKLPHGLICADREMSRDDELLVWPILLVFLVPLYLTEHDPGARSPGSQSIKIHRRLFRMFKWRMITGKRGTYAVIIGSHLETLQEVSI